MDGGNLSLDGAALAVTDPLTGLLNRQAFEQARRDPPGRSALIVLDLDRFKRVNDSLGHQAGDAVLRLAGQRMQGAIRKLRPGVQHDRAWRLGGDEFAILLAGVDDATQVAERLVALLSRDYLVEGRIATIGASAGVAHAPRDGVELDALYRCADLALYAAKDAGRGGVRLYHPDMARQASERYAMEQELRGAVARSELELYFQAQASLDTRRLVGFEALMRWRHPQLGLISPAEFIPLAEETKLILPIGEWALRTACRDAQSWPAPLPVAVNVSPVQLAAPDRLQRAVAAALTSSGLAPERLELEITESALIGDASAARAALHAVRAMGVRVAMDDFGTGFSSLSQLRSFPFDKLKIDRSFIAGLGSSQDAAAVVRAIAALGAALKLRTVAEGVETDEQAAQVQAEGCDAMQGYLFSRPLPAAAIGTLIEECGGALTGLGVRD